MSQPVYPFAAIAALLSFNPAFASSEAIANSASAPAPPEADAATASAPAAQDAQDTQNGEIVVRGRRLDAARDSITPSLGASQYTFDREALEKQIIRLNLEHNVRLLGFRSDVLALMRLCDLFVLPSLAEPFGLVLIEAMALSRPVIATRAGGPLEIVEEGVTGLLVPPSSPESLAEAIGELLSNPERRAAFSRSGRSSYENRFTASRMAKATLAVYRQALSPSE